MEHLQALARKNYPSFFLEKNSSNDASKQNQTIL